MAGTDFPICTLRWDNLTVHQPAASGVEFKTRTAGHSMRNGLLSGRKQLQTKQTTLENSISQVRFIDWLHALLRIELVRTGINSCLLVYGNTFEFLVRQQPRDKFGRTANQGEFEIPICANQPSSIGRPPMSW